MSRKDTEAWRKELRAPDHESGRVRHSADGGELWPGGVITYDAKLTGEKVEALRKEWEAVHRGIGHAIKPIILTEGMEFREA